MEALDIVDRGISHNRGRTLWELYSVRVYKLHTAFQLQGISADKFVRGLEGLLGMLAEVWISSCWFSLLITPNPLSVLCETFQVQKCLRYNEAATFEGKVFELTAKAIAACKETIQFARMM